MKMKLLKANKKHMSTDKRQKPAKYNFQEVNERRKREGKSYVGHYRPKSEFRRQRLQEHLEKVRPDLKKNSKKEALTL